MVLQVLHIGSSLVLVVLYILSLSSRLSNFFFLSQPPKKNPLYFDSSSLFIGTLLILIPTTVLLLAEHSGIFSLFRLPQMYLMW